MGINRFFFSNIKAVQNYFILFLFIKKKKNTRFKQLFNELYRLLAH